ncbi:MAG TPA: nucleotidyl transferase AbiEii/AbiGii toxin family protein [Terriglobia bacterium]|nr:nucleotidyl transferase AbiEii/AbiGii toxin family protein [Terriglobia bacterium]
MWHREVITETAERSLRDLQRTSLLQSFYLAGGTGLALHMGHRQSMDLDFFSRDPFDPEAILGKAELLEGVHVLSKDQETLHLTISDTKVSFLGYRYPLLFPCEEISEVRVADPRDIACMKVSAIASRGTKRDFIDLYAVSKQHGLEHILTWFKTKYAQANYSMVHILKSLTFFEDAEKDPLPAMLVTLTWEQVKQFFITEVPRLL